MLRVLITGGTGFIGRAVTRALLARGDQVTVLTRDVGRSRGKVLRAARVVAWTPGESGPWEAELASVDAVVHLAGAPVAKRWSARYKELIVSSRVHTARALVDAVAKRARRPAVLVSASGTSYYGSHRPDRQLTEDDGAGDDFLSEVCVGWEREARAAEEHGLRTAQLRIGAVLGEGASVVDGMLQLGGAFVGGPIGKGDNVVSWVHVADVVGITLMALDREVRGPVNVVSPNPVTMRELARSMGLVLGRPAIAAPEAVARMILGDVVDAVVGSLDVKPKRAIELGYAYRFPELIPALEEALHHG